MGPKCGNGVCESGESTQNCSSDCKSSGGSWVCGDGKCDIGEQFYCQKDCTAPVCGDGKCQSPENASNCAQDCKSSGGTWVCGDGKCDLGESFYCAKDCKQDPLTCLGKECADALKVCSAKPGCSQAMQCSLGCGTNWQCLQGCFPGGLSANPEALALISCGQKEGCF